jgi:hypothetical protein
MSTTCEVPFEPLDLDGSNYSSWRSNVLIALKVLGPTVEGIMVASILPEDVSYGPPWAHYLGGYQDRLLGGPLGLHGLRYTAPDGVEHKDYGGEVLG